MDADLERFFAEQAARVKRRNYRGKKRKVRQAQAEGLPELAVTTRGTSGHTMGRQRGDMDDQNGRGMVFGRRQHTVWQNLERKHGRMPPREA